MDMLNMSNVKKSRCPTDQEVHLKNVIIKGEKGTKTGSAAPERDTQRSILQNKNRKCETLGAETKNTKLKTKRDITHYRRHDSNLL